MPSDVFVSYKREERRIAHRVVAALKAAGYSVWWDSDLTPRTSWDAEIERELSAAAAVVVLWSPLSVDERSFVRKEAGFAYDENKLVPAVVAPCLVPFRYRDHQTADLSSWDLIDQDFPAWQQVLSWVATLVGRSPSREVGEVNIAATEAADIKLEYISDAYRWIEEHSPLTWSIISARAALRFAPWLRYATEEEAWLFFRSMFATTIAARQPEYAHLMAPEATMTLPFEFDRRNSAGTKSRRALIASYHAARTFAFDDVDTARIHACDAICGWASTTGFEEVVGDMRHLAFTSSPWTCFSRPLWAGERPEEFSVDWLSLKTILGKKSDSWIPWFEWYELLEAGGGAVLSAKAISELKNIRCIDAPEESRIAIGRFLV